MALNPKIASLCFVLAPSHHGATMLSARANLHPHIFSLGDGNPSQGGGQICSCGEDVHISCPFWSGAAQAIGKSDDHPFPTLLPQSPYLASNTTINTWLNGAMSLLANEIGPKAWKLVYEPAERFFDVYNNYLTFCQDWAPHKVFLDAERSALKFMALASMGFPVRGAIHIVRDPRGYAAAWKKYYPESTAEKLGLEWAAAHTRIRRLAQAYGKIPFLTIRYEDLMEQPGPTYEKIFNFMRLDGFFDAGAVIDGRKNHLLGLQEGDHAHALTERPDIWRESLSLEDKERVVHAAGSLFAELGYKS